MSRAIEAVYEHGVLRPIEPVGLEEGTRVSLILLLGPTDEASNGTEQAAAKRTPLQMIEAIAALPLETDSPKFSGRDHDRILYGEDSRP